VTHTWVSTKTRDEDEADEAGEEVSTTMSMIDRIRHRRLINRQNRAIDRAWHSAPTQAMRDEIAIFAQRKVF
jgi:hypothetical protein